MEQILGIHHVTAITADAQANIDFYTGVLGLRLVKLTVNFDDPTSYHLYYGDDLGRPGTILTFFVWPGAFRGRIGPPQASVTSLAIPPESIAWWVQRLTDRKIKFTLPFERLGFERLGQQVIPLQDPDGLQLELIGADAPGAIPAASPQVPQEHAIRRVFGVTLAVEGYQRTADLLTGAMGFRAVATAADATRPADASGAPSRGDVAQARRHRFEVAEGGAGATVDILCQPDARHGSLGAGVVHHVAFRTPTDPDQWAWRVKLAGAGFNVSPVMDRQYFHSIYYREPSGVLFEIATDSPGFTVNETAEKLGTKLILPPWIEPHREELLAALPKLKLPTP